MGYCYKHSYTYNGQTQTESNGDCNGGLSAGAKAGIGIGVAALVILGIGLGWWILRRRRQRQAGGIHESWTGGGGQYPAMREVGSLTQRSPKQQGNTHTNTTSPSSPSSQPPPYSTLRRFLGLPPRNWASPPGDQPLPIQQQTPNGQFRSGDGRIENGGIVYEGDGNEIHELPTQITGRGRGVELAG